MSPKWTKPCFIQGLCQTKIISIMRTNTTLFENSHGKKPKGNGNWWLEVVGTDGKGSYTTETYNVRGTLAEAKKEAKRLMLQEIGAVKSVVEITVLP